MERGRGILLAVASLALSLLVVEILLRLGIPESLYHQRAVRLRAEMKTVEGEHKVLVLGDSFIDNVHCPDCLYPLLKQDLEGRQVKLLNGAESGMGPREYLEQLRRLGPKFRPDSVLLFYYVGNDLTNVQYQPSQSGRSLLKKFLKPLLERFYLYHFLLEKMVLLSRKTLPYEELKKTGVPADLLELAKQGEINHWYLAMSREHKNYVLDNVLMETEENMKAWETMNGILAEIDRLTRQMGSRLAIVILPHTVQVNRSHFLFFKSLHFNLDERTLFSEKPQALMRAFAAEREIASLDLLPYLRARSGQEFYWERDEHFNEAGNRFAEKLVLHFFQEKFLSRGAKANVQFPIPFPRRGLK